MPESSVDDEASNVQFAFEQLAVKRAVGAAFPEGGGGALPPPGTRTTRFGVSGVMPLTTPAVALERSACATCAGDAPGFISRYTAAAPATNADASEVPLPSAMA